MSITIPKIMRNFSANNNREIKLNKHKQLSQSNFLTKFICPDKPIPIIASEKQTIENDDEPLKNKIMKKQLKNKGTLNHFRQLSNNTNGDSINFPSGKLSDLKIVSSKNSSTNEINKIMTENRLINEKQFSFYKNLHKKTNSSEISLNNAYLIKSKPLSSISTSVGTMNKSRTFINTPDVQPNKRINKLYSLQVSSLLDEYENERNKPTNVTFINGRSLFRKPTKYAESSVIVSKNDLPDLQSEHRKGAQTLNLDHIINQMNIRKSTKHVTGYLDDLKQAHIAKKKLIKKKKQKNIYTFTSDLFRYDKIAAGENASKRKSVMAKNPLSELETISEQMLLDLDTKLQDSHNVYVPVLKSNKAVNNHVIRDFRIGECTDIVASSK